jgi:hypothetical protein
LNTLFLQVFDDLEDLHEDLAAGRPGMLTGLTAWLRREKGYSQDQAIESVKNGAGLRMMVDFAQSTVARFEELTIALEDPVMRYFAVIRRERLRGLQGILKTSGTSA